jgi:hypothetical protein
VQSVEAGGAKGGGELLDDGQLLMVCCGSDLIEDEVREDEILDAVAVVGSLFMQRERSGELQQMLGV